MKYDYLVLMNNEHFTWILRQVLNLVPQQIIELDFITNKWTSIYI